MHNILDFGAVGDGKTVNTKAIQAAVDAGGTVLIPEGVFVTGTIYLKSNGGLHLAPGAVLKASHDHADYNAADYCPQNGVFPAESMAGTHLITAVEEHDVFVTGFGTIDGDSHYWVNETHMHSYCNFFDHPPLESNRPAQMLFFVECENVKVQDVTLLHAPFWHLFFHGCENVMVRGVTVRGEKRQWVNDGIDIDCCRNVTVSDCIIETGDDGITLRAVNARLRDKTRCLENVVITGCVLTSYLDYGIRIGVGTGTIKNCLISNVIIKDSLNGIGVTCRFNPAAMGGTNVENLRFSNISIEAHCGIDLKMSDNEDHPPFPVPAYMKNISFDNVTVRCDRMNTLMGFANTTVSNISFSNMDVFFAKEDPANERFPCNWTRVRGRTAAFFVRDAEDVTFKNVRYFYEDEPSFSESLLTERCKNLRVSE